MAINYAKLFNRRVTPQSQAIPGSTQVRNSAGGFSWEVDDWTRLDRFLILGAEGGTYYIGERELVKQNHDAIFRCIKADGVRAVNRIVEISDSGRAPKNDPAIFAMALVATHGNAEAKALAFQNLGKVCRIGTHLFHFAEYVNALRGWGRGLRNAVGRWYVDRGADDLAHQAVKYQQRDGWSHSDLLRLAHARGKEGSTLRSHHFPEGIAQPVRADASHASGRRRDSFCPHHFCPCGVASQHACLSCRRSPERSRSGTPVSLPLKHSQRCVRSVSESARCNSE